MRSEEDAGNVGITEEVEEKEECNTIVMEKRKKYFQILSSEQKDTHSDDRIEQPQLNHGGVFPEDTSPHSQEEEEERKKQKRDKKKDDSYPLLVVNKKGTIPKDDDRAKNQMLTTEEVINSPEETSRKGCLLKGERKYLLALKSIIRTRDGRHANGANGESGNHSGGCFDRGSDNHRRYSYFAKNTPRDETVNAEMHSHVLMDKSNGNRGSAWTPNVEKDPCVEASQGEKSEESARRKKWNFRRRIIGRIGHRAKGEDVCEEANKAAQPTIQSSTRSSTHHPANPSTEENNFVVYKVPRYLKKKNIKCPFVYRKVFFGKYGIINYDLKGNKKGTLVITFHGLNGTNLTFLDIQKTLVKYKYQVLNFDLYGHGLSACPKYNHRKKTYGINFFLTQTEELLTHLKLLHKDFYLIGFSMGCVIAISFAKKYIKQVKKIILISPVGILEKKPFALKVLKLFPFLINISSFFMLPCFISKKNFKKAPKGASKKRQKSGNKEDPQCDTNDAYKDATDKSLEQDTQDDSDNDTSDYLYNRIMWQAFVKKNITHSILGCINNLKMWSAHDIFKEVGLHHIPVLILCGEKDNICSVHVFKNTSKFFINCHMIIFRNASHLVLVEKSKEINSCVLTFFHFPNNADLKTVHHMFPVDTLGNSVLCQRGDLL
ncbi:alpha/beta hydrolase, putative [Plasmodium knowlesi strain H]|uniref:Alpha/beta hydrolase, putative n=3 Tax=Plasmodium knowlesi TaxID=5850 RepID=A0A5K1UA53_PLAKH|nr:alpha/beta hydrolase, putative [Plasmodium knowlesi strain H]OTN68135.1 putative Alpha/beta hydrolase [Plasmodium knowlesi]CAA9990242.1 alpha/beta hydrolase, putative [Plasmodium knowlesi strain H]SBO26815.1 alpha/beta hydrolase, putative [Plasmodium knowlesi strain H]SBO28436.1 alpha/beta hydrolase, putative [Plasmodium knowlesi strain H]VVS79716.1 alpha/beta hydrolase, putative [Plasmodium knowlesi strain H]|eukprot:XP_002258059.1 hypothetical protein, conserved in Plasmodium species [Plasmodium knowlesi strain H]